MPTKSIELIFAEIEANRIIERKYKGTVANELYILEIDDTDKIIKKVVWRNNDRTQLKKHINDVINNDSTNIAITTKYDEWRVKIIY